MFLEQQRTCPQVFLKSTLQELEKKTPIFQGCSLLINITLERLPTATCETHDRWEKIPTKHPQCHPRLFFVTSEMVSLNSSASLVTAKCTAGVASTQPLFIYSFFVHGRDTVFQYPVQNRSNLVVGTRYAAVCQSLFSAQIQHLASLNVSSVQTLSSVCAESSCSRFLSSLGPYVPGQGFSGGGS